MSQEYKANITRRSIWLRLIFMIILAVAFNVAEFVILVVSAFQFLASLFTGEPNDRLVRFGRNMARYIQQIIAYMTFATEEKPFPFSAWPEESHSEPDVVNPGGQKPEEALVVENEVKNTSAATPKRRAKRKSPMGPKTRKKPS